MSTVPDPATALAFGPEARFVEKVLDLGDGSIVCRGRVPAHSPAVSDGTAGTWALLELAAQTAALLQAAKVGEGGGAVSGYLVRVKNARFTRPTIPADTELVVRVERTGGAGPLSLFRARVELDGEEVAVADLGTFAKG